MDELTEAAGGRQTVIGWNAFLPIATAVFAALVLVLFVRVFASSVAVLTLSITIADCLAPVVGWMARRMPRTIAAVIVYAVLMALAAGACVAFVPALVSEVRAFMNQLPEIIAAVQGWIDHLLPGLSRSPGMDLRSLISHLAGYMLSVPVSVGTGLIVLVLIFFLSFYWLVAMPAIHNNIRSLFPPPLRPEVDAFLHDTGRAMGGYLRGVAINSVIIAGLVWIGLHFAAVPYAFPLGLLTGLGEFVPYLGPVLASVPALIVAGLQSPGKALIVLIIYVSVMQIEGHVLTPNIMKSQTDVPQVLVIVAIFAGGAVGGILGALVAVPLAGALLVTTRRIIAPAVRTWTYRQFGKRREV